MKLSSFPLFPLIGFHVDFESYFHVLISFCKSARERCDRWQMIDLEKFQIIFLLHRGLELCTRQIQKYASLQFDTKTENQNLQFDTKIENQNLQFDTKIENQKHLKPRKVSSPGTYPVVMHRPNMEKTWEMYRKESALYSIIQLSILVTDWGEVRDLQMID